MTGRKQHRYPGVTPFSTGQSHIFFGRRQDTDELYRLIRREALVTLYGKSGLGKSSLLNAGIVPLCLKEGAYSPLTIRFGAWTERKEDTPLDITKAALQNAPSLFENLLADDRSLWTHAKSRQLNGLGRPMLIFDQFEELFSYPDAQVAAFQRELSELLNTGIPLRFRRALETGAAPLSDAEEDRLEEPLDARIVFAIRSDRMHLLNRLKDHLPTVLRYTYELQALSPRDAEEAIVAPALVEGDFSTRPYEYSPQAVQALLGFLKDEQDGRVEGILLQTLCEHYERRQVETHGLTLLELTHIGDPGEVVRNYYEEKIQGLPLSRQAHARRLIEVGLVSEGEGMRMSLHEAFIAQEYGVDKALLEALVDSRLLRSERFLRGGYTYELSHDRLVPAVVEARNARKEEEERLRLERKKIERVQRGYLAIGLAAILLLAFASWLISRPIKAYPETQKTSTNLANSLLWGAAIHFDKLDYAAALDKIFPAAGLWVEQDKVASAFIETAFWYAETGHMDTARTLAAWAARLLGQEDLVVDAQQAADRDGLRLALKKMIEESFESLEMRYFPDFVNIPGGEFKMGSKKRIEDAYYDELPQHTVTLSGFQMAVTEITFWQFGIFAAANEIDISTYGRTWGINGNHPAVNVTWFDVVRYANWLSLRKGKKPFYILGENNKVEMDSLANGYRLPTEAQWEYAAGNGARHTSYSWGDTLQTGKAGGNIRDEYSGDRFKFTAPVGSFNPNDFGLFDMSGNVWEWCNDWWAIYSEDAQMNPTGPLSGLYHVIRGGGGLSSPLDCRVARRSYGGPSGHASLLGFRLVLPPDSSED